MSSFTELNTLEEKLTDYFGKVSDNLTSTANPLPSFEDYISFLGYDTILTEAQEGSNRVANYATGALVDTAHLIAAIQREFDMRQKTKASYYVDGVDDMDKVVDYIDYMQGSYTNFIRGKSLEQIKE